jgi:hypothetical protein
MGVEGFTDFGRYALSTTFFTFRKRVSDQSMEVLIMMTRQSKADGEPAEYWWYCNSASLASRHT